MGRDEWYTSHDPRRVLDRFTWLVVWPLIDKKGKTNRQGIFTYIILLVGIFKMDRVVGMRGFTCTYICIYLWKEGWDDEFKGGLSQAWGCESWFLLGENDQVLHALKSLVIEVGLLCSVSFSSMLTLHVCSLLLLTRVHSFSGKFLMYWFYLKFHFVRGMVLLGLIYCIHDCH